MSQPTIIKWQRYLKEHGWLVETGETAADKYTKATRGAHSVPVVRVDDPKRGAKDSLAPESPVTLDNGVAKKSLAPKNFSEGSCFGSGCGSACESGSSSSTTSVEVTADATSKSTPQTNTKTNSKSKTCRKCGEPLYPDKNHTCKAGAYPLAALTPAEGFSPSCTSSGDNVAAQAPQVPPPPPPIFTIPPMMPSAPPAVARNGSIAERP